MRTKIIISVIIVLAAIATGYLFISGGDDTNSERSAPNQDEAQSSNTDTDATSDETKQSTEFIRIAAVGDMLPHDTINLRAKAGDTYNYLPFFDPVKDEVRGSDIVFCNQESPSAGEAFGISGYPSFNAPTQFSKDLEGFGCNLVNLANNHIADKGQSAIDKTLETWDGLNPLAVSGANSSQAQQDSVSYFEIEGMTFAFIAFTDLSNNGSPNNYSVNMFSDPLVKKLAKEASSKADYVIASAHWGVEDSPTISGSQRSWAKLMADNGVDLVIGTGPHVLQPVELIGDTVVYYSLGNFLSTQLEAEQLVGGVAYIDIPIAGGAPKLSFLPTYMSYTWTAGQAAAQDLLARDNLEIHPLDKSATLIEQSLFNTTSQEQLQRVSSLLNQFEEVEILKSN